MPMVWNSEAEARLFAAVIKTSDTIKFDCTAIAEYMGDECSAKAVSHKVGALKSAARQMTKQWTPGQTSVKNPKTPKTPAKKRTATAANADDTEDGSVAKKIKAPHAAKGKKGDDAAASADGTNAGHAFVDAPNMKAKADQEADATKADATKADDSNEDGPKGALAQPNFFSGNK